MTTTSGRSRGTCSQAVEPVGRLADDRHPGLGVDQGLQPLADDRVVVGQEDRTRSSSAIAHLPVPDWERDPGDDRRAPPGAGLDRQRPADQRHPLPHPEQAQPASSLAAVADSASNPRPSSSTTADTCPWRPLEDHAHPPGGGVLEDVRQRLLDHPVQGRLDRRGQASPVQPGAVEVDLDPRPLGPPLGVVRQGRLRGRGRPAPSAGVPGPGGGPPGRSGRSGPEGPGAGPAVGDGSGVASLTTFSPRPRAVRCWPIWSCSSRAIRRRSSSWAVVSRCWRSRRAASARSRRAISAVSAPFEWASSAVRSCTRASSSACAARRASSARFRSVTSRMLHWITRVSPTSYTLLTNSTSMPRPSLVRSGRSS